MKPMRKIELEAKCGRRFTAEERALVNAGKALVCHCDACGSEWVVGQLPGDVVELMRPLRKLRCPNVPADAKPEVRAMHALYMGPSR